MDIGGVGRRGADQDHDHEETDVGAVGWNSQCFNSGGWGHRVRECRSAKKGGKSEGKGAKAEGKGGKNGYGG